MPTAWHGLFRQCSFPGGIPSHGLPRPETPGSVHEGGELGYALVTPRGSHRTTPTYLVCCVAWDGEAETGPLAASWHSNKFLNPVTDGVVLPEILHLNGYKMANPTVLARIGDDELRSLFAGYGHAVQIVAGEDPAEVHGAFARRARSLPGCDRRDAAPRTIGGRHRAPAVADDCSADAQRLDRVRRTMERRTACRSRAPGASHHAGISDVRENPEHLRLLRRGLRSHRPDDLFDTPDACDQRGAFAALPPRASGA